MKGIQIVLEHFLNTGEESELIVSFPDIWIMQHVHIYGVEWDIWVSV